MVDKKAFDFVLSWTFVQKLLLPGRVVAQKEVWNAVPTPNIKENWFAYKNFYTGSSYFTLVLRCYTRDNLSFIHLCCSRRYSQNLNEKSKTLSNVTCSHPTTPLLAGLMLISSHIQHSLQLINALHFKHTWCGLRFTVRFAVLEFTLSLSTLT